VELEPDQLGGGGRVGDLDPAGAARWRGRGARGRGGAAMALAGAVLEIRAALVLDVAQELQELASDE
jgi:hypothetical protein